MKLRELKEVWELEADYLALCVVNTVLSYSPERIILGGGVMGNDFLFPMVRAKALALLGGNVQALPILEKIDDYIVPPGLGERSGIAEVSFSRTTLSGGRRKSDGNRGKNGRGTRSA
jgi:fructokinase